MKGKAEWAKSSNGPDWTDVAITLKAVEDFHKCHIVLTLGGTAFSGPSLFGSVSAIPMPKRGTVLGQPIMAIPLEYPCKDHRDLVSCVYAAVLQIDHMLCTKVWEQICAPFTAE